SLTHSTSSPTACSHASSPAPGGSTTFRFAPAPSPLPVSSAKPRKCGNHPAAGSTWTDATRTSGCSKKISCVPFPWCASTSRAARGQRAMGEDVGDDPILAGVGRQAGRGPFVPRGLQVGEELWFVHRQQHAVLVRYGCHLWRPRFEECCADGLDPRRGLSGRR